MFTLAHLSDLHLAARPQLAQLIGKRGLGFINWHRGRKHVHRPEILDAIARDLKGRAVDHIAVTGDLVNFSLRAEYLRARAFVQTLGPPANVTVIPGNHDVYVPRAIPWPAEFWGDYMSGDEPKSRGTFPFLRRRAGVALIALSSAVPTGAFMATGHLGSNQIARLGDMLAHCRGLFRIVLIHHPPVTPPSRHLRRLVDAEDFCRVLAQHGAELVLHGHDHRRAIVWLDGPDGPIPALGVPSASARAPHHAEDAAGYTIYRIDGEAGAWRCGIIARQRDGDNVRETAPQVLRYPLTTTISEPAEAIA
jgi:3',5'-cyclic AMP phosphodiesterase CpdA